MQLRDMFISCLRRWYFVAAGFLLTAAGSYAAFTAVHPTYDAKASIVLIPPKVAVTTGDNPYLYLGGLDQALGVLQVKMSSPEVSGDLIGRYPGGLLVVARDATTTGPILSVTATADDPASSLRLLQGAEDLVPSTLATLQAQLGVPSDSVITSMKLSADETPTKVSKKQLQTTAMVGIAGAAATVILVGLLDRVLTRRRQKKPAVPESAGPAGTTAEEGDSEAEVAANEQTSLHAVPLFRERPSERVRPRAAQRQRPTHRHAEPIAAGEQAPSLAPASLDDARP